MTKTKSAGDRRAERLAARAAERKEDAELDLPVLGELLALANGRMAEVAAEAAALAEQVIARTTSGGLVLDQQIVNAAATAKNLGTVAAQLIKDAEAQLKAD